MDLLAKLNPEQRVAVEHGNGPALVLAGAGSGKTRVITFRIAYLVQNSACRPENILAVTFTNKAAREMRDRVHALLGPRRSAEPLISTFHSFCVRLLRREIQALGYRRDFSIYDSDDQKRLIKQILDENPRIKEQLNPREALSRISFAKNQGVAPDTYADRFPSPLAEDIEFLYRRYVERLRKSNALDFDDLLLKSVQLLQHSDQARRFYSDWYRFILVDEYQDTNRPQYDLLRLLTCQHNNLFVVGDEDQSIYKFRGADIQNILRFERDFPGTRVVKLEQNYRSTGNILGVAARIIANNTERKGKTLWTEGPAGDVVTCRRCGSARDEAAWVSKSIAEMLEEDPGLRFAVLYRANFLSRNFEDVLLEQGMRYAVVGSVSFFARAEVKDLLAYLRLLFNPEDDVALLRILNVPARGIGPGTVEIVVQTALELSLPALEAVRRLVVDPSRPGRLRTTLQRFLSLVDAWAERRDTLAPADLLRLILDDTRYREWLKSQDTAEEAASRLDNIEELITATEESGERGETVFEFLDRASLSSELDSVDSEALVVLMTLHSAKGLEFDVVFLAGMEEGLFPHSFSMNSPEDLEEERRLCYVGVTRARQKLFLTWTPYRRGFSSEQPGGAIPSRFLREMPEELIEGMDEPATSQVFEDEEVQWAPQGPGLPGHTVVPFRRGKAAAPFSGPQPKTIAELKAFIARRQSAGGTPTPSSEGKPLKAGARVRHFQFGDGIVLSRQKVGADYKLVVTFSRVGRKTLIERFAKLEVL